jgi:hypothetical protein
MNNNEKTNYTNPEKASSNDISLVSESQRANIDLSGATHQNVLSIASLMDPYRIPLSLQNTNKLEINSQSDSYINSSVNPSHCNLLAQLLRNNLQESCKTRYNRDCSNNINNIIYKNKNITQRVDSISFLGKKVKRDILSRLQVNPLFTFPTLDEKTKNFILTKLEKLKEKVNDDLKEKIDSCLEKLSSLSSGHVYTGTNKTSKNIKFHKSTKDESKVVLSNQVSLTDHLKQHEAEAFKHKQKNYKKGKAIENNIQVHFDSPKIKEKEETIPSLQNCKTAFSSSDNIRVF